MLTEVSPHPLGPRVDDDADFDYVWTIGEIDVRVPDWVAQIVEHPRARQMEMFLLGMISGLLISGIAVLIGFYFGVQ